MVVTYNMQAPPKAAAVVATTPGKVLQGIVEGSVVDVLQLLDGIALAQRLVWTACIDNTL